MARRGSMTLSIDGSTKEALLKAVDGTGLPRDQVISEALKLYATCFCDVNMAQPSLDGAPTEGEDRAQFIYDRALLSLPQAAQMFSRSEHWYRKLEAQGVWKTEDGSDIPVYRDSRGKRWFSGANIWEMANALYREGLMTASDVFLVKKRAQHQLAIEEHRKMLVVLRKHRVKKSAARQKA